MKHIAFPLAFQQMESISDRFDAFKLTPDSADVLFAMYPAGTHIEEHRHDTENYGVITKGELRLIMDGEETRYGPGDWYHVPRHTPHAAIFDVETEEIEFWIK